MEPLIPNGSWCIFRFDVTGSRQGRILLVQHESISDPETGGSFTVKRYTSQKTHSREDQGGSWGHAAIQLEPMNNAYQPIPVPPQHAGEIRVIAEFVRILPDE